MGGIRVYFLASHVSRTFYDAYLCSQQPPAFVLSQAAGNWVLLGFAGAWLACGCG